METFDKIMKLIYAVLMVQIFVVLLMKNPKRFEVGVKQPHQYNPESNELMYMKLEFQQPSEVETPAHVVQSTVDGATSLPNDENEEKKYYRKD